MSSPEIKNERGLKSIRILLVEDNPGDVYLLEKTLQEEVKADKLLTDLAAANVNKKAA